MPSIRGAAPLRFRFDGVAVDTVAHRLTIDGRDVSCSRRVFQLLTLLAESPGRVYSRDEITARLWPGNQVIADESLTQIVFRLRATLGRYGAKVVTVRGVGLRLDAGLVEDDVQAPASPAASVGSFPPAAPAPPSSPLSPVPSPPATPVVASASANAADTHATPSSPALPRPASAADTGAPPAASQQTAYPTRALVIAVVLLALGVIAGLAYLAFEPGETNAGTGTDATTAAVVDPAFALYESDLYASRPDTAKLIRLALEADAMGDRPRAQTLLEAAARDPTSPLPALYLGYMDYAAGNANWRVRIGEAEKRLAVIDDPYLRLVGDFVMADIRRDWNRAMGNAGSALDLRPDAWFLRLARAHLLIERSMDEAALAELRQIKIPRLGHRKLEMALVDRAALGDVAGARDVFARLEPGDPAIHHYIKARIDYSAGDEATARSGFAAAADAAMKSNRLDVRGKSQLYGGILAAAARDDDDARQRLRDAQVHLKDRNFTYDANDAGFLLAFIEARSGTPDALRAELDAVEAFVAEQADPLQSAMLELLELRLVGEAESSFQPDAGDDVIMRGARSLVAARRELIRGDRRAAATKLATARSEGVFDTDFADEARLLAHELGVDAPPAKRIDPPYPPLSRFTARFALADRVDGAQKTRQNTAFR